VQPENYIYYPEQLNGEELDAFLEKGWYRMGQSIFTTHYISLEDQVYRVFWLRYNLQKLTLSRRQLRLIKRNERFSITKKPFKITDELEELFALYKTGIDFEPALSVQHWLHGDQLHNVFSTELLEIRDNKKLIAAGITDSGHESIAGIMNFYHPEYKKYSPGKYLMLLKIQYAKAKNIKWYYPGYIVYNHSGFDYKLFVDKNAIEIFIPEMENWELYNSALMDRYGNGMISFFESQ
jgi:arginyl-tRNA--protein-N-Asp/Glu arginylyltransferase